MIPGRLLESRAGEIRWSLPDWDEPWVLDPAVLDSVGFASPSDVPVGAFRVLTIAGDILQADLEAADDESFHFASPLLGSLRIRRDAVRMMERTDNDTVRVFLASGYRDWVEGEKGPIRNLRYRVYEVAPGWEDDAADPPGFSQAEPIAEGRLPGGRIDFGVTQWDEPRAIVFEGEIRPDDEDYRAGILYGDGDPGVPPRGPGIATWSRFGIGDQSLELDRRENPGEANFADWSFAPEWQPLRVEHVNPGGGDHVLVFFNPVGIRNPDPDAWKRLSLMAHSVEPVPGWRKGRDGNLMIDGGVSVFREVEMPESFELELELASGRGPRFVLGLGESPGIARSTDAFRLETWDDGLVVTRGASFEPLRILGDEEKEIRLRLCYDGGNRHLKAVDHDGTMLAEWRGARIDAGPSGLCLVNKGDDLTIRRLCLTRITGRLESVLSDRHRVRLRDGTIVPGTLHQESSDGAWFIDSGGERRPVDPGRLDRVATSSDTRPSLSSDVVLDYGNGTSVRGRLIAVGSDALTLSTAFIEEPVVCSREGLASLVLETGTDGTAPDAGEYRLHAPGYALQGRLLLEDGEEPLRWLPAGARRAQSLSPRFRGRFQALRLPERDRRREDYPHRVHLEAGDVLVCRAISCDSDRMELETQLMGRRLVSSRHVRAVELDRLPIPLIPHHSETPFPASSSGDAEFDFDAVSARIREALILPRFLQDRPPTHLLVAGNGDVRRGNLLALDADSIRFETRLREMSLPRDLISKVVRIAASEPVDRKDRILAVLWTGSRLIFEHLAADADTLVLQSATHGRSAIPLDAIRELTFGDYETDRYPGIRADWVVRSLEAEETGSAPR